MQIAANCSKLIKFSQIHNFDVQNNFLLVNKALLVVLTTCFGFVKTKQNVVPCFQRFVQHLDQTLEKVANALRIIFHAFLNIFVKHCQRFYNGLNNITNALTTIINTFKMHYNTVIVKPSFPK